MNKFKLMIAGKERLVITFWIWGVIGIPVFLLLVGVVAWLFGALPVLFVFILVIGYWIPVAMGVWQSSDTYQGPQIWAILAKVAVALSALNWIYQVSLAF